MILVVLNKWLSCAVDKTTDTRDTTNIDYNTNYGIILLVMILFLSYWCKTLKTDHPKRYLPMPFE